MSQYRRLLFVFGADVPLRELPDGTYPYVFYEVMRAGDPGYAAALHASTAPKPFSYGGRPCDKVLACLASFVEERAASVFAAGLKALEGCALAGSPALRLLEWVELPPYRAGDEESQVLVDSVRPVTVSVPEEAPGKKLFKRYLRLDREPEQFCLAVADNLAKRALLFGCGSFKVDVQALEFLPILVNLYGGRVLGYRGRFLLSGPPQGIAFAVHAGLGERTGSGLGCVVPTAKRV